MAVTDYKQRVNDLKASLLLQPLLPQIHGPQYTTPPSTTRQHRYFPSCSFTPSFTDMASESYVQKLQHYCATNQIAQPQFQDYSDPRGIRTAWSSSVFVHGREYRAHLWRDYRYLEQSREEAAEVAWKALNAAPTTSGTSPAQYSYNRGYTASR